MKYEGLLSNEQKRVGYFIMQDDNNDFIFLFHRRNGSPDCIGVFLYDDVRIKEIRESADEDIGLQEGGVNSVKRHKGQNN